MKTHPANLNPVRINHTPRILALVTLAILLLCAVARGRGQTPDPTTTSPADIYTLASVDGKSVPCIINHEGPAMTVQSGTFTITTNGRITSVMTVPVGDRKNVRAERAAAYTVKHSELTMPWKNAGRTRGRVAGQTFTMNHEVVMHLYRR